VTSNAEPLAPARAPAPDHAGFHPRSQEGHVDTLISRRENVDMVEYHNQIDADAYLYRRRASDRARERAGRAAWYGDRAGLLIATGTVEALVRLREDAARAADDVTEDSTGT
jgi:hypothetical protein